ncbi:MAG: hypothetical protein JO025_09750 [Verrucomicrobia bacterium]|nr:hypothetical protein [Verrucomicrobiota bacterium]
MPANITGTKTGPFQKSSRTKSAHVPQGKGADLFRLLVIHRMDSNWQLKIEIGTQPVLSVGSGN